MSKVVDINELKKILPYYHCSINSSNVAPLGNGLINSTYLVRNSDTNFVLQRINSHVFKQPEQVINNAELINHHLLSKKQQNLYSLEPMWQINSKENSPMVKVDDSYWRAIQFIPNCYSVEKVETPDQAHQAATAFAQFTSALSDFPATDLAEIIPDFHHLDFRLKQLKEVVALDPKNRLSQCQSLVDFCFAQHDFIKQVSDLIIELPVQVTHNDTKINNLLFNAHSNEPIAVIDLDTCMPGFVMHDFGDMVRTCCSNLAEDGTELEKMMLRLDIFSALAKGYISTFGEKLADVEKSSLIVGAQLLPFMIGIRFLTDYIDGDNYFHVDHDSHNLARAKNQLHLYRLLHDAKETLAEIVSFS